RSVLAQDGHLRPTDPCRPLCLRSYDKATQCASPGRELRGFHGTKCPADANTDNGWSLGSRWSSDSVLRPRGVSWGCGSPHVPGIIGNIRSPLARACDNSNGWDRGVARADCLAASVSGVDFWSVPLQY